MAPENEAGSQEPGTAADTQSDAEEPIDLMYQFSSEGQLVAVHYHGELTPEIHARIKRACYHAREIGKGRVPKES